MAATGGEAATLSVAAACSGPAVAERDSQPNKPTTITNENESRATARTTKHMRGNVEDGRPPSKLSRHCRREQPRISTRCRDIVDGARETTRPDIAQRTKVSSFGPAVDSFLMGNGLTAQKLMQQIWRAACSAKALQPPCEECGRPWVVMADDQIAGGIRVTRQCRPHCRRSPRTRARA